MVLFTIEAGKSWVNRLLELSGVSSFSCCLNLSLPTQRAWPSLAPMRLERSARAFCLSPLLFLGISGIRPISVEFSDQGGEAGHGNINFMFFLGWVMTDIMMAMSTSTRTGGRGHGHEAG